MTDQPARPEVDDPRAVALAKARYRSYSPTAPDDWDCREPDVRQYFVNEAAGWLRVAVAAGIVPPADGAAKAEALLLHFVAEAHRRKWAYDRGLDDDGVPLKSEAFDALHRLGEEMRTELEKLRRRADEEQQP